MGTCCRAMPVWLVIACVASGGETPHQVVRIAGAQPRNPVEVAVAINPTNPDHLIAVCHAQGPISGPRSSNYAFVSDDGGKTWKTTAAPNPDQRVQGDDAIAFGPDGTAYWTYIAFTGLRSPRPVRAATGIFVNASRDGLKWAPPVPVIDHINTLEPFEDKPWIAVDTSTDSPHRGNVYVAWTKFDVYGSKDPAHKSHIYLSRSRDAGKTFSVPLRVSEHPGDAQDGSNTVEGAVPAIGPGGEVYLAWAGPKGIVFTSSTDGGWSWAPERVLTETPGGWDLPVAGFARHNGLPVTAADFSRGKHRGSVYISWIDKRHGDADVFLLASRDSGATWGPPVRVNDDRQGNGKAQAFAWMAIDRFDGSVNLVFYDRRDQDDTLTGLTLARSIDGGKTFVNHRINQKPFRVNRVFLGDYIGIDAVAGRVVAAYSHVLDNRQIALSAALFRFRPGTQDVQEADETKKAVGKDKVKK